MNLLIEWILKPLGTAGRTLTILPLPGSDTPFFGRALLFFSVIGGFIATIGYALYQILVVILPDSSWLAALLLYFGIALLTGALHLDGFADSFDAFGSRSSRERMLEIFKDPRLGTYGVLALIFNVTLKVSFYERLIDTNKTNFILASLVLARGLQPLLLAFIPYARKEGGTASVFCNQQGTRGFALFSSFSGIAIVLFLTQSCVGAMALVVALLVLFGFSRYCILKLGGIIGDCVGAANEFVELAFLTGAILCFSSGLLC